jgi:hypothetical protein
MFDRSPRPRRHNSRYRPRFEFLEVRMALAADPFSVELVAPAAGSVLHESPSTLTLRLSEPIFPDTLSTDFAIVQTDSDGNPTWYTVPDQVALDESATVVSVTVGERLAAGHYQVWVFGTTGITGIDGRNLAPDGNNLILGDFDVKIAGVTLGDALDLGAAGSIPIDVPGYLDFQANPYAVNLYRIQLDPGHFWRLGLEVTAQRDGGTLDSALALFDAQGHPIASDETGRSDAPYDPFLFAGVQPGTYFIGVSGTGNLVGTPGAYDPIPGSPGSVAQVQPGGPYTLHIVADPVDSPPQLRSLSVDFADQLAPTPIGLTLGFTRTIAWSAGIEGLLPTLNQGIEVRDEQGQTWPVQASGYDEAGARVSYLFEQPLPPGHYTVDLPAQGGIVDLAGLSPVAPGEPPGQLGSFDVPQSASSSDPFDLGALLPGAAMQGRSLGLTLGPGESVTYHLTVTMPGIYQFHLHFGDSVPMIQIVEGGWTRTLEPGGTNDTQLTRGEYAILVQNPGTETVSGQLDYRGVLDLTDLFLSSGVGQGPGLSLRLISYADPVIPTPPTTPIGTPSSTDSQVPIPTTTPAGTPSSTDSQVPTPTNAALLTAPGALVASLILTPSSQPVTQPGLDPSGRDSANQTGLPTQTASLGKGQQQTAPIATLSFLGMESGLIGRPSTESIGGDLSPPGIALGKDPLGWGVGWGQPTAAPRGLRTAMGADGPEVTDLVLVDLYKRSDASAIDASRLIPLMIRIQRGADEIREGARTWFASWPGERPSPETPRSLVVAPPRAFSPAESPTAPDHGLDLDKAEAEDEAETWPRFLSPVAVALSVTLAAQLSRRVARRWFSRNRRRVWRATGRLDRGSAGSQPVFSDQDVAAPEARIGTGTN